MGAPAECVQALQSHRCVSAPVHIPGFDGGSLVIGEIQHEPGALSISKLALEQAALDACLWHAVGWTIERHLCAHLDGLRSSMLSAHPFLSSSDSKTAEKRTKAEKIQCFETNRYQPV
jgi:hypothetical protein